MSTFTFVTLANINVDILRWNDVGVRRLADVGIRLLKAAVCNFYMFLNVRYTKGITRWENTTLIELISSSNLSLYFSVSLTLNLVSGQTQDSSAFKSVQDCCCSTLKNTIDGGIGQKNVEVTYCSFKAVLCSFSALI